MIKEYRFGLINVDGKEYTEDLEVRWDGKVLPWQRESSHLVGIKDIERAVEENPEVIVIGTGELGLMKITEDAQ